MTRMHALWCFLNVKPACSVGDRQWTRGKPPEGSRGGFVGGGGGGGQGLGKHRQCFSEAIQELKLFPENIPKLHPAQYSAIGLGLTD